MSEMTPAKQVIEQQADADRLEELFQADGRHSPSHPQRGLFTGLAMEAATPLPVVITEEEP
jgi:hypothetical protein